MSGEFTFTLLLFFIIALLSQNVHASDLTLKADSSEISDDANFENIAIDE
jgi:hypothetical protein